MACHRQGASLRYRESATLLRMGALMWSVWHGDFRYAKELADACHDPHGKRFNDFPRICEEDLHEDLATPTDSRIYFVQSGVIGRIKIGVSMSVEKRLKTLACGAAEQLHLLGSIPGGTEEEQRLHIVFARHRVHGEWFRPADDLLEFIRVNARAA